MAEKLSRMKTELELTGGFNNAEVTADFDKSNLVVINGARANHNGFKREWVEKS